MSSFLREPDCLADWVEGGHRSRAGALEKQIDAYKKEGMGVDLSAYFQANDNEYLGINGVGTYTGRAYGNDSSNMQCVLNRPSYWKRVMYRPSVDEIISRSRPLNTTIKHNSTKPKLPAEMEAKIEATLRRKGLTGPTQYLKTDESPEAVLKGLKTSPTVDIRTYVSAAYPKFQTTRHCAENTNFFNTLGHKYSVTTGRAANVDRKGHTSRPSEVNFIAHKWRE